MKRDDAGNGVSQGREDGRSACVEFLLAGDGAYTRPMGVVLDSLARQGGPTSGVVVDFGMTTEDRTWLEKVAPGVRFHLPPPELFEIYAVDHFHPSVFARLFLTHYFDEHVSRVLFLDGDILVRGDVSDLATSNLHGRTLGAVPLNFGALHSVGPLGLLPHGYLTLFSEAGVPLSAELFNCGVMVIDFEKWRIRSVEEKLPALARQYHPRNDQDLLNILLWDDWTPLPHTYNSKRPTSKIYHFASNPKPWEPDYFMNKLRVEYRDAAARVGWPIEQPALLGARVRARSLLASLVPPAVGRS